MQKCFPNKSVQVLDTASGGQFPVHSPLLYMTSRKGLQFFKSISASVQRHNRDCSNPNKTLSWFPLLLLHSLTSKGLVAVNIKIILMCNTKYFSVVFTRKQRFFRFLSLRV